MQSALNGNSEEDCFCDMSDVEVGQKIFSGKNMWNLAREELFEIVKGGGDT